MFFGFNLITFLGAFLLFQLELMVAQKLLPLYGGSFSVWASCMMFFQFILLLGYFYAYTLTSPPFQRYPWLHLLFLGVSVCFLPFEWDVEALAGLSAFHPSIAISLLLLQEIGVPFFLLSTTAIIQQKWLVQSSLSQRSNPYVLYSISNLGAFVAFISYPLAVQPYLKLSDQFFWWYALYGCYVLLHGVTLPWKRVKGEKGVEGEVIDLEKKGEKSFFSKKAQGLCFSLSAGTSALLIGVTNLISLDISPGPLLWIFPLALYLLSFIVVFSEKQAWVRRVVQGSFCGFVGLVFFLFFWGTSLLGWFLFYISFLWLLCCVSHGILVRLKPQVEQLGWFYLLLAGGGFVGSVVVNLIFPFLLRSVPTLLVDFYSAFLWLLLCYSVYGWSSLKRYAQNPFWMGLGVGWIFIFVFWIPFLLFLPPSGQIVAFRNFYGVSRVVETGALRWLFHGTTVHGSQSKDSLKKPLPFHYYRVNGPFGVVFHVQKNLRQCAVVGLGVGSMFGYSQAGQSWFFYEINPDVDWIAKNYFDYLSQGKGQAQVVLGDARLTLKTAPDRYFDLVVIDAFSSDAIPTHLLTVEAFQMYLQKLKPEGMIALHVSNRYLNLVPVLARMAQELKMYGVFQELGNGESKAIPPDHLWYSVNAKAVYGEEELPGVRTVVMTFSEWKTKELLEKYDWKSMEYVHKASLWTDEQISFWEAMDW